ncbi:MAG TPA: hypothetical protein VGS19_38675 [Streptosporangiaceae bacterium]|nr:hypothetical protein [Streptosporangiaceae bacterium]
MRTYTNLAWPQDPYRTGQQLYRSPAPRLAAFTVGCGSGGSHSAAIVYLPLHRTKTLTVTQETLTFGFHAASANGEADTRALAGLAGLDLLQARRHAAVLTGHLLPESLTVLRALAGDLVPRGVIALEHEWADRRAPAPGRAAMLDCGLDLPGAPSLAQACQQASIGISATAAAADTPVAAELAVAAAVHRALGIALVAARHLDRYTWGETLHTEQVMAGAAWDFFPQLPTSGPAAAEEAEAAAAGQPDTAPRTGPE